MKNLILILAITLFCLSAKSQALYGTASKGGLYGGGSIYKYDVATATKSDVYDFSKINEIDNYANYFCELNGKLYATAGGNGFGRFNQGLLYEYNPITNTYTTLYHFGDSVTGEAGINGGKVMASLTILNGKLYGATSAGGASNLGVLFVFDPTTNVYTKLKDLTVSYGNPNSPLILASDGNFYGTTKSNGTSGITPVNGVIYKYNLATNALSVVAGFPTDVTNGLANCLSINQATNGKFYGIAEASGGTNSAIFECDIVTNTITKKASFGATTLLLGGTTVLYDGQNGSYYCYSAGSNSGSIFEYNIINNTITAKYTFNATSGVLWLGAGINPTTGTFYGHTISSAANPYGEIFEYNYNTNTYSVAIAYTISGSIYGSGNIFFASNNKAYSFCSYKPGIIAQLNIQEIDFAAKTSTYKLDANVIPFGNYPSGNLLKASDNKLYGTTLYGTSNNSGCFFSFDPTTNTMINIQNFYQKMGTKPNENLVEVGGKIYGTTNEGGIGATGGTSGVLFEYTIATNTYVVKKTFTNIPATGYSPIYGLIIGKNGNLYGQASTSLPTGRPAIFEYNILTNTMNWVFTFPVGSYNGALSEDIPGVFYTYGGAGLSKIDINTNTITRVSLLGGTTTGTNGTGKPLIYNNAVYCSVGPCIAKYDIATATTSTNCNGFTSIGAPVMGGIILASNNKLYYNSLTYPAFSSSGVSGNGWLGQVYELDSSTLATNSLCNLEASMGYYPLASLTDTSFASLAIKNNFLSNNFKIYPNPSSGNFNIEVDENLIGAKATVYNLLGQKVKDFYLKSTTTNQTLNKGMYLFEIDNRGSKITKKLIVN